MDFLELILLGFVIILFWFLKFLIKKHNSNKIYNYSEKEIAFANLFNSTSMQRLLVEDHLIGTLFFLEKINIKDKWGISINFEFKNYSKIKEFIHFINSNNLQFSNETINGKQIFKLNLITTTQFLDELIKTVDLLLCYFSKENQLRIKLIKENYNSYKYELK